MSTQRRTISGPVTLEGTGLFSAAPATITIAPRANACGICFEINSTRIDADINHLSTRPVHPAFRELSPRCTCLERDHTQIATIEHLMSALYGLGVTDAIVRVDGPEIPIFDGSADQFVRSIVDAGIRVHDECIKPIRVASRILVEDGDASITIEPAASLSFVYTIDYGPRSPIPSSTVSWDGDADQYASRIAPARTFCLEHEAHAMRAAGLFGHLSAADMLVIGDEGPIETQYRFADECARHKLLDLIGDISLVGRPIIAKICAVRSGHAMAHRAARAILDQLT